jgi:hypothetical protein
VAFFPTGLDFGPDGALYVADWIDGWGTKNYGRIWKMDDKNLDLQAERKQTKTLLAADFKKSSDAELSGYPEECRYARKVKIAI